MSEREPKDEFEKLRDAEPRTFNHKGMMVDEFIVDWDGRKKLIWVKSGYLHHTVDTGGNRVPLIHSDFVEGHPPEEKVMENITRRRVQEGFEKHYNLK